MLRRLNLLLLIMLAFLLPFEMEEPWLDLGLLALTNVELLLGAVLAVTLFTWWRMGHPVPPVPVLWGALGALFVAGLLISSLLAPSFRANALKAALRTLSGMALALAVSVALRNRRDVRWLTAGLVAGGLVAAIIGLNELTNGMDLAWLAAFRPGPTVAGPFLRLSGPFDYANQAGMFMEATAPLLLALTWRAKQLQQRRWWLLAAALSMYALAALFTFSRATLAGLILVNGALALWLWLVGGRRRRQLAGALAALGTGVLLLAAAGYLLNPSFRMRFQGESDSAWYQARIEAPAALEMPAGSRRQVRVTLTNEGAFTWRSAGATPVYLAARWVHPESDLELRRRPRWALVEPLAPGETATMTIDLQAPEENGTYRLQWDLVQEQVTWFGAKTGREISSSVTVSATGDSPAGATGLGSPAIEAGGKFETSWQYAGPIPGRRTLWATAWRLWRERPLLGIGLDNFRLRYGEVIGYSSWNRTIHTNNWYVETVVSLGLLGALPFLFWLGLLVVDGRRALSGRAVGVWRVALAAGMLAYLIHGLLDYFLLFNATALLFWMLVGMWMALERGQTGQDPGMGETGTE